MNPLKGYKQTVWWVCAVDIRDNVFDHWISLQTMCPLERGIASLYNPDI
jgi:hypothetical protein